MKLGIQPLLPIGNFLNKRYIIEMDFPPDSNPAENFKYLNETVMAIHMAEFPMFYKDGKPLFLPQSAAYSGEEPQPEIQVKKLPDEIQATLDGINACTELEGLNGLGSFWLPSKGNLNLLNAYKAKEKQLKDAK